MLCLHRSPRALCGAIVALLLSAASATAQTSTWDPLTTNQAWTTTTNWSGGTPGKFPGVAIGGNPNSGLAGDIAAIGNLSGTFNSTNGIGIDFGATPGVGGILDLVAIDFTSSTSIPIPAPMAISPVFSAATSATRGWCRCPRRSGG